MNVETVIDARGRVCHLVGGRPGCPHGPKEHPGRWLRDPWEFDAVKGPWDDVVICSLCGAVGKVVVAHADWSKREQAIA